MSYGTAKVVSIRLTDKERAKIEAALPKTLHRGYSSRTESRSEFIVRAALERAERLLQERNTDLEGGITRPGEDGDNDLRPCSCPEGFHTPGGCDGDEE